MSKDMIFWDEMWNKSESDQPNETKVCCSKSATEGPCFCKQKNKD
jgi:hypothetical protein